MSQQQNKKKNDFVQQPKPSPADKVAVQLKKPNRSNKKNTTSQRMELKPWMVRCIPVAVFLIFAVIAYYMLAVRNTEYLFTAQEHSLWLDVPLFLEERMMFVGGLSQWLGCYFTQFFYYPWLGTLLLIVFWAMLFFATIRTFHIPSQWSIVAILPCVALLCSEIDLGYWLYYIKMPGYWFTHTICVLTMMLSLWGFRAIQQTVSEKRGVSLASFVPTAYLMLWTIIFYPLIGSWALIGTVAMMLLAIANGISLQKQQPQKMAKAWLPNATLLVIGGISCYLTPTIYYQHYTRLRIEDAWVVNFPHFQNDKLVSTEMAIPFYCLLGIIAILLISTIICPFYQSQSKNKSVGISKLQLTGWTLVQILSIYGVFMIVDFANYDNYNYHAELRMHRAIDESRWQDVLEEAANAPGPVTRQMVLSKNMALMNTGQIGNMMFKYDNSGEPPYTPDSLSVHLVQTMGTQLYYNYGKANFACRWAIEDGVEFGFDIDDLKMLVRTSMLNDEDHAAQKYINLLMHTTFYRKWAEERLAMLKDKKLYAQSQEYKDIQPLRCFKNTLDGDEGLCEMYLINYFSNMHSKELKFQEQTLAFALIQKDIQMFWPRFFNYATLHEKEPMPIHYQEAAYLYGQLEHEIDISNMPFDKERVVKRYQQFQTESQALLRNGMSTEQVGQELKYKYGDTFWWFYFFCRNVHTY